MTEIELSLLHNLRSAVKNNPELFASAIMFMQDGVNQRIKDAEAHSMQMEKLAVAFQASASKKHTQATVDWVERMIDSVKRELKYFRAD